MTDIEALETFLRRALSRRADRYVEFAKSPKRRRKFLDAIHHDLESDLNSNLSVPVISADILDRPAYLFVPPTTFGRTVSTLREIAETHDDAMLAVSHDATGAVLRPETYVDSAMFFEFR